MILQRIIFPQNELSEAVPLYYRSTKPIDCQDRYSVKIPPNCIVELSTYFNSFFSKRWRSFTPLKEVRFCASLKGKGSLLLLLAKHNNTSLVREVTVDSSEESYSFSVPLTDSAGFYYVEIRTENQEMFLQNAWFDTDIPARRSVNIAVVMCTHRREHYVQRTAETLLHNIWNNLESALQNHLDLYLIDNGRTLDSGQFPYPQVTLIPNCNTGGSGGFTRGLIEVLYQRECHSYTHVLLMDDDICFDSESLERTYALLCYVKDKYLQAIIGGAMLRNDSPCVLEEAGANWKGRLLSVGYGLDLSLKESLHYYESIGNTQYQAWWFCCIPLSLIGLDNLPLPFFVHGDDTEYGLRNFQYVLQLNGICVWHNTFNNKRPSHLEYYDARNQLIVNSIHSKNITLIPQIIRQFKRDTALILRMRYDDVLLSIRGIDDFLSGPEWWANQDSARLHQEVLTHGYQYRPLSATEITHAEFLDTSSPLSIGQKIKCVLTVNGLLLPKYQPTAAVPCGSSPFYLYRRKDAFLLDPDNGNAIHVSFSAKRALEMYFRLFWAFVRLIRGYPRISAQYQKKYRNYGTVQYWKRCINIMENIKP